MVNFIGAVLKTQTSESKLNFSHQKVKSQKKNSSENQIDRIVFFFFTPVFSICSSGSLECSFDNSPVEIGE